MTRPPPKPIQFRLRSLFLVTSTIAVAFGVLKWLGPWNFLTVVFFATPVAAMAAIMLKGKGGWYMAWAWFLLLVFALVFLFFAPFIH